MKTLTCWMTVLLLTQLASANTSVSLVDVEVMFVAYPKAEIESLARNGKVGNEQLMTLWKEGKGSLLASPRVVTKVGQEVTIKAVKECIYPTAFMLSSSEEATNTTSTSNPENIREHEILGVPQNFETREIGVILQVTPQIVPEGNAIDITLALQHVFEPEWVDYAKGLSSSGKEKSKVHFEQPFFFVNSLCTSVTVMNGERALLGGGMETPDKTKFVYAFASATIVDAKGRPIKGRGEGKEL